MAIKVLSEKERHDTGVLRRFQVVLLLFSLMFLYILFSGYVALFSRTGVVGAVIIALGLAFLAWFLGSYIGMSHGALAKKSPLFAMLLILSAAGVFNWMMITFEGKTIFLEAVSSAQDSFVKLEASAQRNVINSVLAAKELDTRAKEQQFLNEVKNPLNCGYGPVAEERERELVAVLPNLRLPSSPPTGRIPTADDCARRADVFKTAIDQEWSGTEDAKGLDTVRTALSGIIAQVGQSTTQLDALRKRAESEGSSFILGAGRDGLTEADETYRKQVAIVRSYAPDPDLPSSLDLTTISRLGEWSQIVSVIASRLDHLSTYVYFLLAIAMDSMLVYLFTIYRNLKLQRPRTLVMTTTAVPHLGVGDR